VGDIAHGAGRRGQREAQQPLLLGDVEQFVLGAVAVAAADAAADQQVVLLEHAPGRIRHLAALDGALRQAGRVGAAELARAGEVRAHHAANIGVTAVAAERHHRDRQGRGVAADDVDFQAAAGLRQRRAGGQQQQRDEQAAGDALHAASLAGTRGIGWPIRTTRG